MLENSPHFKVPVRMVQTNPSQTPSGDEVFKTPSPYELHLINDTFTFKYIYMYVCVYTHFVYN